MNNPFLPKPYKIIDIKQETELEYTFKIETDMKPYFGQFCQVSIPKVGEAPISICAYGDGWLDMTIRKVGTLTNKLFELNAGDTIFLRGPYGIGFDKENYKGKHLIVVTGGTGLAPIKSLINHFNDNIGYLKKFDLIMGFKNPDSVLFGDEIEKWKANIDTILTVDEACGIWGDCVGLVTEHVGTLQLEKLEEIEVIIVGPPMMMKFTALEFLKKGIAKDKIWVSFERNMSCALGKCGHCKIDETYVCIEGPVFRYSKAESLID